MVGIIIHENENIDRAIRRFKRQIKIFPDPQALRFLEPQGIERVKRRLPLRVQD